MFAVTVGEVAFELDNAGLARFGIVGLFVDAEAEAGTLWGGRTADIECIGRGTVGEAPAGTGCPCNGLEVLEVMWGLVKMTWLVDACTR